MAASVTAVGSTTASPTPPDPTPAPGRHGFGTKARGLASSACQRVDEPPKDNQADERLDERCKLALAYEPDHGSQIESPHRQATAVRALAWCPGRDLNSHGFPHTPLKRTCLPIPPPGHASSCTSCESKSRYFLFGVGVLGAAGVGAGDAGAAWPPVGGVPPLGSAGGAVDEARFAASETTLRAPVVPRVLSSASDSDVTKNSTPSSTVARVTKSVAPRPPNTVCVAPPNAPPARPPPFPD